MTFTICNPRWWSSVNIENETFAQDISQGNKEGAAQTGEGYKYLMFNSGTCCVVTCWTLWALLFLYISDWVFFFCCLLLMFCSLQHRRTNQWCWCVCNCSMLCRTILFRIISWWMKNISGLNWCVGGEASAFHALRIPLCCTFQLAIINRCFQKENSNISKLRAQT